jgi:uncharacterized protein YjdB
MTFISVTDITNFSPLQAIVGQEIELTATVSPTNATNKEIDWSVVSGNATIRTAGSGATKRSYLTATKSENITVRATVRNGKQA